MQKLTDIDLVIASGSEKIHRCLQEMFIQQGANVVLCGCLDLQFVEQLEHHVNADVILIDMDDSYEEDEDALDLLLEKIDLPILFHDNDFDELNDPKDGECFSLPAIEKLAAKLAELVENEGPKQKDEPEAPILKTNDISDDEKFISAGIESLSDINSLLEEEISGKIKPAVNLSPIGDAKPLAVPLVDVEALAGVEPSASAGIEPSADSKSSEGFDHTESLTPEIQSKDDATELVDNVQFLSEKTLKIDEFSANENTEELVNVWVLGASIGGPEAVKRFLARIPAELPVAFVLAQHLGDGFVSLLANQLDRVSAFSVKEAVSGDALKHGEVVVVPVDNRMSLDSDGKISFVDEDWKGHYKPSIDCVIDDVTNSFEKRSGIIIFSGMGADGVLACQQFSEKYNGSVWAQSSDTCVISSMPDSVRKANLVSYSGSPEALALKIAVQYMGKESYIL